VTTLTGKKIIETWKDARIHVEEVEPSGGGGCGYVQDLSSDLQVGVVKPWLLLGEYVTATKSVSPFTGWLSHPTPYVGQCVYRWSAGRCSVPFGCATCSNQNVFSSVYRV
jgi:hypothetical protein